MQLVTTTSIVLAGFESAGKTALFRRLTGEATGHEANFRGSTITCRSCHSPECGCNIVDTPGIRLMADTETTRLALEAIDSNDTLLIVVRGTNLQREIEDLLPRIRATRKRLVIAVTFADKDQEKNQSARRALRRAARRASGAGECAGLSSGKPHLIVRSTAPSAGTAHGQASAAD